MKSHLSKNLILTLFSLVLWFPLFSQQNYKTDVLLSKIDSISAKAISSYKNRQFEEALELQKNAISLFEDNGINDAKLAFELYLNMFNICVDNRLVDESLAYAEKAKLISEKHNIPTLDRVELYNSLAFIENEFNSNPQKALGYITLAHEILLKEKKSLLNENPSKFITSRAVVLEWFVTLQMRIRDETALLNAYSLFKSFYEKHRTNKEVKNYFAQGSFRMGRFYQNTNADLASKYFAYAIKEGNRTEKIYGNICSALGYLHVNRFEKIPPFISALNKIKDLNRFEKLNILELKCDYYAKIKNIDNLIISSNEALTLLNDNNTQVDVLNFDSASFKPSKNYKYPVLLYQFGRPLQSSDDERLAITANKIYKLCLAQFDERIGRTSIENYALLYSILRGKLFNHILKDNLSYEEKADIISKMERIETQSEFNTMLSNRSLSERKTNLDSLFSKEISIREEITQLKQNNATNDSLTKQQLFKLELDLENLYRSIDNANPHLHEVSNNKFSLNNLAISDDQAIFRFYKGMDHSDYMIKAFKEDALETHLYRVKITTNTIEIEDVGDYESIENDVIALLNELKSTNTSNNIDKQSELLYHKLFKNTTIPSNTVIISDNILRYLPFEVLKNIENYLIESTVISYASGLSYLSKLASFNAQHTASVSFFAPSYSKDVLSDEQLAVRGDAYNLEGAKEEVKTLSKLTNGNVYEGNNASKNEFLNLNDNVSVIHYAGHAFINDEQPELSSFIFSDNETDNTLAISELYGFKSNASLAVLSACNTGVGGYTSGKGIVSLSEAFLYAGIPSTVSSLWSAPDNATKDIMVSFYTNLTKGESKSNALRNAKLNYLKQNANTKLTHPYYWAGFVLYGNDAPITLNKGSELKHYILFGLVLVVIGLIVWYKKRAT